MNRSVLFESNGGILIDIGCSEPNILTCKIISNVFLFLNGIGDNDKGNFSNVQISWNIKTTFPSEF